MVAGEYVVNGSADSTGRGRPRPCPPTNGDVFYPPPEPLGLDPELYQDSRLRGRFWCVVCLGWSGDRNRSILPLAIGWQVSSNSGVAYSAVSGLTQYGFCCSLWTEICPERSTRYVWLGSTSTMQ